MPHQTRAGIVAMISDWGCACIRADFEEKVKEMDGLGSWSLLHRDFSVCDVVLRPIQSVNEKGVAMPRRWPCVAVQLSS